MHLELVDLQLLPAAHGAFPAPQLTARGAEWLAAPGAAAADLGRRRVVRELPPMDSVPEPAEPEDAPLVEAKGLSIVL